MGAAIDGDEQTKTKSYFVCCNNTCANTNTDVAEARSIWFIIWEKIASLIEMKGGFNIELSYFKSQICSKEAKYCFEQHQ